MQFTRRFMFWALLPVVATVVPILLAGDFILLVFGLAYLVMPPVAFFVVSVGLAVFGSLGGMVWLWVALVRPSIAIPEWIALARGFVFVGCMIAGGFLFSSTRTLLETRTIGNEFALSVAQLQCLVVSIVVGVALLAAWRTTTPRQAPTFSDSVPLLLALWLLFGVTAVFSHRAIASIVGNERLARLTRIHVETADPFTRELCAGDLAAATARLGAAKSNPDIDIIVERCLHSKDYSSQPFPERLRLTVKAILQAQAHQASAPPAVCTSTRRSLLAAVFVMDVALAEPLSKAGWPLNCSSTAWAPELLCTLVQSKDGFQTVCPRQPRDPRPLWWDVAIARRDRSDVMTDLHLLDRLGIDWQQKDVAGRTILAADAGDLASGLPHEALLFLFKRSAPSIEATRTIAVDLLRRRFMLDGTAVDRQAIATLYELVGDPSTEALTDPRTGVQSMLSNPRLDQRALTAQLLSILEPNRKAAGHFEGDRRALSDSLEKRFH